MPDYLDTQSASLHFTLPSHGDSVLNKMRTLREQHRFCDITLVLRSPDSSAGLSVHFHGHRVVLAASSDFLRDQFLLHEDQAVVIVAAVPSVRVAKRLLLSCYTGLLEVPLAELLSYLTAASVFQMNEVMDKCTQALSQYLKPNIFLDKPTRCFKETENYQLKRSWLCSTLENQREKDVVQPCTSIQKDNGKEEGAVLIQAMHGVSQESEVDSKNITETIENRKFVKATTESSEDQKLDLNTLKSEESVGNTIALKDEVFQDFISVPAFEISGTVDHTVGDISQIQQEQEDKQDKNNHALKTQQEHGGNPIDFKISSLSGERSTRTAEDLVEASSRTVQVQTPYLCRKCDKIFQYLENYTDHLKEHRQYSCLVCGEGFSQRSKLTRHVRVHPDVKPFRCPLCHETFIQKVSLQEHLHLHTGCKYTIKERRNQVSEA
ncbi:zinc finger and BTB domain-containing protein 26-like [Cyprinodon tularosa]|uniref:zinc finger and BTB domain-containing protein 26-like n=1 Tax=Cyprinodon tularosa TaxID=77115 RepID=UPI0018E26188|nr:zinc finger and BTB domain-containing protein 26-like [Cyprinodon tularosa]